jgi:hypothetical protein
MTQAAAVLVPYQRSIEPETDEALRQLERRGVPVYRQPGCSAIDLARNQLASCALLDGKESILFIDSDIWFDPDQALYLLNRPEPVVAGLYSQKRHNHRLNVQFIEAPDFIDVGQGGRDYEVEGVGAGFLRVATRVLQGMIDWLGMPSTDYAGAKLWPFFLPQMVEVDGRWRYECEDYAFCRRVRQAGFPIILDTRIRLYHLGVYPFGWEDSLIEPVKRRDEMTLPFRSNAACT